MVASLLFPDLPALALQMALGTSKPVLVVSGGRVVAPHELAGMSVNRARTLRPLACPLTRQPALERAAWDHILGQLHTITPQIEETSLGRLLCSPDNMPALRRLTDVTHARVGIAPTRTLALLAALSAKAGGMVVVDFDELNRYLDQLPVAVLRELPELCVDQAMTERLTLLGFGTVGRMRRLTRAQLQAQFGDPGIAVHEFLHTITDQNPLPLYVPPPTVEVHVPSYEPTNEPGELESLLHEALAQAMVRLGSHRCGRLELALLDPAQNILRTTSRILRSPTAEPRHLLAQTMSMLTELTTPTSRSPVPPLASTLRLHLGTLSLLPPTQLPLFIKPPTHAQLSTPLAQRFPQAIKRVTVLDPHAYLPERFASVDPWKPLA